MPDPREIPARLRFSDLVAAAIKPSATEALRYRSADAALATGTIARGRPALVKRHEGGDP